ncbi:glycosyltransferase family 39 protein [Myxococcota bacterium]|nr:glycosyltransferase family 39 protein [Myxococcota bacterium]
MNARSWIASSLLLLVVIVLLRAQGLWLGPVDIDETDYLTIARMMREGAVLYADATEKKPPLAYLFYYPFTPLGWVMWPVQLGAIAWLWATSLVARRVAVEQLGRADAGVVAAWGTVLVSASNVLSVNLELLANLPVALALFAHVRAERTRRVRWDLAAGVFAGLAAGFKHQAGIVLAAIGLAIAIAALARTSSDARSWWLRLSALAAGFAIPGGLMLGWFVHIGHLDAFLEWNLDRNFVYIGDGEAPIARRYRRIVECITLYAAVAAPLFWLFGARALGDLRTSRLATLAPGRLAAVLLLWLTWIPVSLGGRFYNHYFLHFAVPLALVAAPALTELWDRRAALTSRARRLWIAALVVPVVVFQLISVGRALVRHFPSQEPRMLELSTWLRTHTRPDERLFAWGHFTPIYYYAQRLPGTRYLNTTVHIGDLDPGQIQRGADLTPLHSARDVERTLADLEANRPAIVVDTAPADIHHWSLVPLPSFPRLAAYVHENYDLVARPGGAAVYRRRASPPSREDDQRHSQR